MTRKSFLVVWDTYIVNATSWAHVLPSSFIQQLPSCAAPRAWILLIDLTYFLIRVYVVYFIIWPYSDCIAGYYMDGTVCTPCAAEHYKAGTNTDISCSPCATGHSTNGSTTQASCTCECSSQFLLNMKQGDNVFASIRLF